MRLLGLIVLAGVTAQAQTPACDALKAITQEPAVAAAHWGLSVTTLDGTSICTLNEAQLFHPESNAKLFTTAAALALLGPQATLTTTVTASGVLKDSQHFQGNLVLFGTGDANLSGRTFPYTHTPPPADPLQPLDDLAAQVAATGLKTITGDIQGVNGLLREQRYPAGWAQDDLIWGYGAPITSLSVADNELKLTVRPASRAGQRAVLDWQIAVPYYTVTNDVLTVEQGPAEIAFERLAGPRQLRVYGRIALKAPPEVDHLAIEDPAEFAALALRQRLAAHGVTVSGKAFASHAQTDDARSFREISSEPLNLQAAQQTFPQQPSGGSRLCPTPCDPATVSANTILATHISPTLAEDVTATNKESLNLHAELLLRRLGARFAADEGPAGSAEGARVVRQFLVDAGLPATDFLLYDGSGLSTYDLVTPRAITQLLRFAATQSWGAAYKASLPLGGVDGTLATRFTITLKGRVWAKTGTSSENRALSGYLTAASGQTIVFSILVSEHRPGTAALPAPDRTAIDRIVEAIAASN